MERCEKYSEKVDIYSFALVLYFMATGDRPFHTEYPDPERLLQAYSRGEDCDGRLGTAGSGFIGEAVQTRMKPFWQTPM